MTRVYLASRFSDREVLRGYAHELWELGFPVTSRWLNETARPPYMTEDEFANKTADADWLDLKAADLFIRFLHDVSSTGGADTEFGIALEAGKLIWLVGPYRNIFHRKADRRFDSWDQVKEALKELPNG